MTDAIGVQFQRAGKIYDFEPGDEQFEPGDRVVVETSRGVEMATVVLPLHEVEEKDLASPLRSVMRRATDADEAVQASNEKKAKEAHAICMEKIAARELDMKLVDVEYTFDNTKIIFYFTADGRVDFRELVKDLASVFHTRIELRQIGVRDEAKIIGGIGICGRPLCCHRFLSDFSPVSIKMAKEQSLSLNPSKISGCCGRLLCCLTYENDNYVEWHKTCPECTAASFSQKKVAAEPVEEVPAPKPSTRAERQPRGARDPKETEIIIEEANPAAPKPKNNKKPKNGAKKPPQNRGGNKNSNAGHGKTNEQKPSGKKPPAKGGDKPAADGKNKQKPRTQRNQKNNRPRRPARPPREDHE